LLKTFEKDVENIIHSLILTGEKQNKLIKFLLVMSDYPERLTNRRDWM